MDRDIRARGLFRLAGFRSLSLDEIPNPYGHWLAHDERVQAIEDPGDLIIGLLLKRGGSETQDEVGCRFLLEHDLLNIGIEVPLPGKQVAERAFGQTVGEPNLELPRVFRHRCEGAKDAAGREQGLDVSGHLQIFLLLGEAANPDGEAFRRPACDALLARGPDALHVGLFEMGADARPEFVCRQPFLQFHLRPEPAGQVGILDLLAHPPLAEHRHAGHDADGRGGHGDMSETAERDVRRPDQAHHVERFEPPAFEEDVHDRACDPDGGEHADHDAEHEGRGEPLHRAGPDKEQDECGDERGEVAVDDGDERALVAAADGQAQRLAAASLLSDTLVDEHVRVDRHAKGQHQPRDAGQGHHRLQAGHGAEHQKQVEHERKVGDHAGGQVIDHHESHHEDGGHDAGADPGANAVLAELSAHGVVPFQLDVGREASGAKRGHQVVHFRPGEGALDDSAAGDARLDGGRRVELLVEDDGQSLADVLRGQPLELPPTHAPEAESDRGHAGIVVGRMRVQEILTGYPGAFRVLDQEPIRDLGREF